MSSKQVKRNREEIICLVTRSVVLKFTDLSYGADSNEAKRIRDKKRQKKKSQTKLKSIFFFYSYSVEKVQCNICLRQANYLFHYEKCIINFCTIQFEIIQFILG